jgi:hypothetical protein
MVGNTFIVDVERRAITVLWADGKSQAREIPLAGYTQDIITTVENQPGFNGTVTEIYSFYPKLARGRLTAGAARGVPALPVCPGKTGSRNTVHPSDRYFTRTL